MLEFVLRTSTNVFCQYCPRREGLGRGAAVRNICQASWPSPTTTLDRKRTIKRRRHLWWVEGFAVCLFLLGVCMGVWEWMCECKFVFMMPFLCADSGPWRTMSVAWSPMSAITTSSGSTCPCHRESAWGAAETRQERVILVVVIKGIVAWRFSWTHLQIVLSILS